MADESSSSESTTSAAAEREQRSTQTMALGFIWRWRRLGGGVYARFPCSTLSLYDVRRVLGYDGSTDEDRAMRYGGWPCARSLGGYGCASSCIYVYAGVLGGAVVTCDCARYCCPLS